MNDVLLILVDGSLKFFALFYRILKIRFMYEMVTI